MLTPEEIKAVYDQGPETVRALVEQLGALSEQQQAQRAHLTARVKELADRVATKSCNRSKPPSSDGLTRRTRALRAPSSRKTGGPPGQPGPTRAPGAEPDQSSAPAPEQGGACGTARGAVTGRRAAERRQVFAWPPVPLVVTAPRVLLTEGPGGGQDNVGAFPAGVACGGSSGAGVKSLRLARNPEPRMPSQRSCQSVADLCGQPVAEGTLSAAGDFCATALAETAARSKPGVLRSAVAHCDETGR